MPRTYISPPGIASILMGVFADSHHHHNYSRTVGSTAGVGPGVVTSITPFAATSAAGANNFGVAILVFDGTEGDFGFPDAPISSFDPSEIFVTAVSANGRVWSMRFAFEQTKEQLAPHANAAAAVAAGDYSEISIKVDQTNAASTPMAMLAPRLKRGSKVWVQAKDSTGTGTISFLVTRLHGYPGVL
jgi:hypothetical protein